VERDAAGEWRSCVRERYSYELMGPCCDVLSKEIYARVWYLWLVPATCGGWFDVKTRWWIGYLFSEREELKII
jgi:hypothetical protein